MSEFVYAVLDNAGTVTNIVTADNDNAAAVLSLLLPAAADIRLTTQETGPAYIGGDLHGERFRMPQPYPSWAWDDELWSWVAPVPYPEGGNGYYWDENLQNWIAHSGDTLTAE